jgi:ornithine decarboxylase
VTERENGLRWVYLDVGRYNGLIETDGEAIAHPVSLPVDLRPVD